jgi:hypothetical protein
MRLWLMACLLGAVLASGCSSSTSASATPANEIPRPPGGYRGE